MTACSTGQVPFLGIGAEATAIETGFGGSSVDAFGRLRVGEVTSLLDIKQTADKQPLLVDEEIIGTGTSVHSTLNASTVISTAADADVVIRQTFQRPPYFAGKGQQFFFTFSGFEPEDNVTKRVGAYNSSYASPWNSDLDGVFIESSGGVISANVYKTGTLIDSIPQSEWNCNTFLLDDPENNPSGVVIDWTKPQILEIDYEWLGVGSVRFGFVNNGVLYTGHKYNHVNSGDSTYMTSPNQPIRYEIRQAGAGSGSFETICSTAGTEGAQNQIGKVFSDGTKEVSLVAASSGTFYALLGLRLKTDQPNVRLTPQAISIMGSTNNDYFYWEVRINPTVAGTFTYADKANSGMQVAIGVAANTVTGGQVLSSGYGVAQAVSGGAVDSAITIGMSIDGTPDEAVLCLTPFQGSTNIAVGGGAVWKEID